jgi:hypothetical protein
MSFRAEVISDTHLNMWKYKPDKLMKIFSLQAPNLILAGDIGDPDEPTLHSFLDLARQNYNHVFYIPGNHEFYGTEPGSKKNPAIVLDWFQKLDDQWSNFHFFYRRNQIVDGIRLIGATCWSTAPTSDKWAQMISAEGKKDIEFIEQGLSKSKEPVLIVSHYPSTLRVIEDNFRHKLTQFNYGQDLERLYRPPLNTWIFGHVHQKHDFSVPYASSLYGNGKVRILCNPYGYPNEPIAANKTAVFQVTSSGPGSALNQDQVVVKSPYGMSYRMI